MNVVQYVRDFLHLSVRCGFRRMVRYERERLRRQRALGRAFNPRLDGEPLLRHIGATEEQIVEAKKRGMA